MKYPVLSRLNDPDDLRNLTIPELNVLIGELRDFIQTQAKAKEGHIRSSLGVTELTVALHYSFKTPWDKLIWDVGHQAYLHKVLTGRKDVFHTNRKLGGISGFTRRSESEYDPFGAGHSSTSISAAVGFALAARLQGIERQHIAVIGDGALTGGESFEAMNYLGQEQLDVLIILNDNESSIDANVGGLSQGRTYRSFCSSLNIDFCGEIDGHNVEKLVQSLSLAGEKKGPRLIQVRTQKGKGFKLSPKPSENERALSFQDVFSSTIVDLARSDYKVVAVSPAMLSGSGLDILQKEFPERVFDVGIAEQHAVTMAAALAADGFIPFCHLYSTFSQRAYDQIIHDVALQNLPVVFCLDRAGLVGEDGPTHHGNFDVSFLMAVPNLVVSAPMDLPSLASLLRTAAQSRRPFCIRYPKSTGISGEVTQLPIGKMRKVKDGKGKAILSFGAVGEEVVGALKGLPYAHYDMIYLKPLDEEALQEIFTTFNEVITVEESSISGGLGHTVAMLKAQMNSEVKIRSLTLPDTFIEHGSRKELLHITGLNAVSIRNFILNF